MRIRPAQAAHAERLRAIAQAAKGHWGYDRGLVERWASTYDFPRQLREQEVLVAERDGEVAAWAAVTPPVDGVAVLEDLWVEPARIGEGIGSLLFSAICARAAELGAQRLEWQSEPNATGFYERLGARHLRDEISEWGRTLPVMGIPVL